MNRSGCVCVLVIVLVLLYVAYGGDRAEPFVDARCGVDLPSCPSGLRCINGYCRSDVAPTLPTLSDLPMIPMTHYDAVSPQ